MTDRLHDRRQQHGDERRLADRLDVLTSEDAEHVIRRALELQDSETLPYGVLDVAALERIALELGIPVRHVRRALAEHRTEGPTSAGPLDRMLGCANLSERAVVTGERVAIETTLATWLGDHEGLRMERRIASGATWERDPGAFANLRMGLGLTYGTRSLRSAGQVKHSMHAIENDDHLVAVAVNPRRVRLVGGLLLAAALLLAAGAGVGVALGAGSAIGGLLAGLWTLVIGGTGVVAGVRAWTRRIRRAVGRAIDAVTDPDRSGVFETLPERVRSRIRSALGMGRHLR